MWVFEDSFPVWQDTLCIEQLELNKRKNAQHKDMIEAIIRDICPNDESKEHARWMFDHGFWLINPCG
jgi:hypothetical protein